MKENEMGGNKAFVYIFAIIALTIIIIAIAALLSSPVEFSGNVKIEKLELWSGMTSGTANNVNFEFYGVKMPAYMAMQIISQNPYWAIARRD